MAPSRLVSPVKRAADRVAPALVARLRWHMLKRPLAARRRPLPKRRGSGGDPAGPVILFFAPEAGIAPHFISHLIVARTLKELGHRVIVVRCVEHLGRCIVMDSHSLPVRPPPADRRRICVACVRSSLAMVDAYGLEVVDLGQVVDGTILATVRAVMDNAAEDLEAFSFEGVAFGKLANGDVSRMLKINNAAAGSGEARDRVRQSAEAALTCYLATKQLCRYFDVLRLVYFNDYAMTIGAAQAAQRAGATVINLSHAPILNSDRRRIMLLPGYSPIEGRRRLDAWPAWRPLALPPERIALIGSDTMHRFGGRGYTVYSPRLSDAPERLFDELRLARDRRLLVAYTSSQDEVDAVRFYEEALSVKVYPAGGVFHDQFEWLESLVECVEASADLQLVIRVHPREDRNRREGQTSENLEIFRAKFDRYFKHVRVVWPRDPVSSYDLGAVADLVVISLSSIGLEFARLGVPVISSFPELVEAPDGIFIEWAGTRDDYFAALRRGLAYEPGLPDMVKIFRWFNARYVEAAVDVSDIMPDQEGTTLPPFVIPRAARTIEEVVIGGRHIVDVNRERLASMQGDGSSALEEAALRRHFRHVFALLMLGHALAADYQLLCLDEALPEHGGHEAWTEDGGSVATVRGATVSFRHAGRVVTRRLPMAARLARLAGRAAQPTTIGAAQ